MTKSDHDQQLCFKHLPTTQLKKDHTNQTMLRLVQFYESHTQRWCRTSRPAEISSTEIRPNLHPLREHKPAEQVSSNAITTRPLDSDLCHSVQHNPALAPKIQQAPSYGLVEGMQPHEQHFTVSSQYTPNQHGPKHIWVNPTYDSLCLKEEKEQQTKLIPSRNKTARAVHTEAKTSPIREASINHRNQTPPRLDGGSIRGTQGVRKRSKPILYISNYNPNSNQG